VTSEFEVLKKEITMNIENQKIDFAFTMCNPTEVSPCIWQQAGILKKRMCLFGYLCGSGCTFHAGMMMKDRFRNHPSIKPFLDKVNALKANRLCRYTLSPAVSFRLCANLYRCEHCEFHQMFQDDVSHQLDIREARRKIKQEKRIGGP